MIETVYLPYNLPIRVYNNTLFEFYDAIFKILNL